MNLEPKRPTWILPLIILSQFSCTSIWFASNAVLDDLIQQLGLASSALGYLTSAVQFGFISGTLVFAFLLIADRFSPSRVFMICGALGAAFNLGMLLPQSNLATLLAFRFFTGFCLAGVYPIGMKISADWFEKGLGKALGYLVGALVLGTAFPHLLKFFSGTLVWENVVLLTSGMSLAGALIIGFGVPNGPYRKRGTKFSPSVIRKIFNFTDFRAAAFGYFGHMWELYAFWTFVPLFIAAYFNEHEHTLNYSFWCFMVISLGAVGCVVGGYLSLRKGSAKVAFGMLLSSGILCLVSPLLFQIPLLPFFILLLYWGFVVVGDSAQFSTLVAQTAPKEYIGSALTIVNCIGFAITIASIQLLNEIIQYFPLKWVFLPLVFGPIFGLWSMRKFLTTR